MGHIRFRASLSTVLLLCWRYYSAELMAFDELECKNSDAISSTRYEISSNHPADFGNAISAQRQFIRVALSRNAAKYSVQRFFSPKRQLFGILRTSSTYPNNSMRPKGQRKLQTCHPRPPYPDSHRNHCRNIPREAVRSTSWVVAGMVQLVEAHRVQVHNLEQVSRIAAGAGYRSSLASRVGRRKPELVVEGIQVVVRRRRSRPEGYKLVETQYRACCHIRTYIFILYHDSQIFVILQNGRVASRLSSRTATLALLPASACRNAPSS